MASLGSFVKQIGHYSLSSLAVMVAGLISYPILTRVLAVEEYGVMGAVITLLNICGGVSKMGLQYSIVRFWPEWTRRERGAEIFILTLFIAMASITLTVTGIYLGGTFLLRPFIGWTWVFFISISSPLIVLRTMTSFGLNVLRAQERSKSVAGFEVLNTYLAMILALVGATTVIGGLTGYYLGLATGEALLMLIVTSFVLRATRFRRDNLSGPLVRQVVAFGLPMGLFEMIGILFYMADRFVILGLLDEKALGYYTVAYNLGWYVNMLFTESVDRAAVPRYSNLYEEEGLEATSEFLTKATRYFFLFALPAVAGLAVIREDLLVLLASEKFKPGATLVPLLLSAFLLYGVRTLMGAGLFIKKQPWTMAGLNLAGVALNVALNFLAIPWLGLMGAAVASLVSQLIISQLFWLVGSRHVPVRVDFLALLRHALCAAAMAAAIHFIPMRPGVLRLVLHLVAGAAVYAGLLVAVDREARELVGKVIGKLKGR